MEIIALFLIGLCFGSFINALVWRLRHKRDFVKERSECTHCHHTLAWNDLVPVVSWALLRGKCRYCGKRIDDSPVVELITPMLFVISYLAWPFGFETAGIVLFVLWLIALVGLIALTVYDLKWYLLPDKIVFPLIAIGLGMGATRFVYIDQQGWAEAIGSIFLGILSIAGVYLILHVISSGKWVGFGDVKLSVFIGSILGWQGGLLALFMANLLGIIVVIPLLTLNKLHSKSKIPFGPFLIGACFITFLWGGNIIDWYVNSLIGL